MSTFQRRTAQMKIEPLTPLEAQVAVAIARSVERSDFLPWDVLAENMAATREQVETARYEAVRKGWAGWVGGKFKLLRVIEEDYEDEST